MARRLQHQVGSRRAAHQQSEPVRRSRVRVRMERPKPPPPDRQEGQPAQRRTPLRPAARQYLGCPDWDHAPRTVRGPRSKPAHSAWPHTDNSTCVPRISPDATIARRCHERARRSTSTTLHGTSPPHGAAPKVCGGDILKLIDGQYIVLTHSGGPPRSPQSPRSSNPSRPQTFTARSTPRGHFGLERVARPAKLWARWRGGRRPRDPNRIPAESRAAQPAEILMVDAITQLGIVVDVCFLHRRTSVTAGTIFHRRRHPCGCWSLPSAPSTQPRHDDRWRVRSPMPTTRRSSWSSGKRTYIWGAGPDLRLAKIAKTSNR